MKIYKEKELKTPIDTLDLGKVLAGETKKYTFFVYNESTNNLINLEYSIDSSEIKIISSPKELKSKEQGLLEIEFISSVTLKEPKRVKLEVKGLEEVPYFI